MTRREQERRQQTLEQIAARHLEIETLAIRRSDSLDFHEVAVWGVKAALEEAYKAGRRDAARQRNRQNKES